MSETTNYGLYITADSSETFKSWREKINGTTNSNMTIIDEVLGGKADNSVAVNATLLASAWLGTGAPYTQELPIQGLKSTSNGVISIAHTATAAQREAARNATLSITGQDNGVLTIVADSGLPTTDIPVFVVICN